MVSEISTYETIVASFERLLLAPLAMQLPPAQLTQGLEADPSQEPKRKMSVHLLSAQTGHQMF